MALGLFRFSAGIVLLGGAHVSASYPAVHPFENEAAMPSAPLAATPSYVYTNDDEGGYMYYHCYAPTYTVESVPAVIADGGMTYYQQAVRFNNEARPPRKDPSAFNCTAKGDNHHITSAAFPGGFGKQQICEEGECCSEWHGKYGYFGGKEEDTWARETYELENESGVCDKDGMTEAHYCVLMGYSADIFCVEYLISPSEMLITYPCYDTRYWFLSNCALYKETGWFYENNEPDKYFEASSPDQLNAHTGVWFTPSRVCQPYSYYHPELTKAASTEGSGSVPGSTESSSTESDEESSVGIVHLIFGAAISYTL